jgi:predicted dehydrogenase
MKNSEQIAIGAIGTGGMGGMHAENLQSRVADARLVAVADLDTARAEKLEDELQGSTAAGSEESASGTGS